MPAPEKDENKLGQPWFVHITRIAAMKWAFVEQINKFKKQQSMKDFFQWCTVLVEKAF